MIKTVRVTPTFAYDTIGKHDITDILNNTLKKFKNENNINVIEEAQEKLEGYIYVPNSLKLWEGRYVRYLNLRDPLNLVLGAGGFVVEDNTFTVKLRNDLGVFRVNKRNALWFMSLTNLDKTYMFLKSHLKNGSSV
tara:strand:- start:282 stop:689 length:408 start_codon:yes stop_codon:yes gene_type:complete